MEAEAERGPWEGIDEALARRHAAAVLARQEERTVLVDLEVSNRVRQLARDLGEAGAGPREAALLHHRALRALTDPQPARRARALHEAGQTVFIELLGELAGYYRQLALESPAARHSRAARSLSVAGEPVRSPADGLFEGRGSAPEMVEPA